MELLEINNNNNRRTALFSFWKNLETQQPLARQPPVVRNVNNNTNPARRHPPVQVPTFSRAGSACRAATAQREVELVRYNDVNEEPPECPSVRDLRSFFSNPRLFRSDNKKIIRTRANSQPREIGIQGLSKEFASTLFIDECEICFEADREGIRLFNCGHEANCCLDCIKVYATQQIITRNDPRCPTCTVTFDLIDICALQVLEEITKKHMQIYRTTKREQSMIGRSDFFWCPTPNCDNPLLRERISDDNKEITCEKCKVTFCFEHKVPAHLHVCAEWKETEVWVNANAKRCPGCDAAIEKDGGCPHMACRCGYEFYWCCLSNYKSHLGRQYHDTHCR